MNAAHVFVTITVRLFPLWERRILVILWVFLLGSCPFSVLFVVLSGLLSSRRNANLAGGFAGRLRLCRVVVLVYWICRCVHDQGVMYRVLFYCCFSFC